jgi:hypothetical protein
LCLRGFLSFAFRCGPVTSGVFTYTGAYSRFGGNAKTGLKPYLLSAGKGLSLRIRPAQRPCYSDIVVLAPGSREGLPSSRPRLRFITVGNGWRDDSADFHCDSFRNSGVQDYFHTGRQMWAMLFPSLIAILDPRLSEPG